MTIENSPLGEASENADRAAFFFETLKAMPLKKFPANFVTVATAITASANRISFENLTDSIKAPTDIRCNMATNMSFIGLESIFDALQEDISSNSATRTPARNAPIATESPTIFASSAYLKAHSKIHTKQEYLTMISVFLPPCLSWNFIKM